MGNLDNILKKKIKSLGIERQVEAVGVVEAATEEIAKLMPKEDFEIVSFKDGVIKIYTNSSEASSEIQLRSAEILKNLNFGEKIKRIRVISAGENSLR